MRDTILQKSVDLFQRYGYAKTTLTDIAKSVGKVKSAIYYYFGGKEEIFSAIVRTEANDFYSVLQHEIDKVANSASKIDKYIELRIGLMQQVADRYSFLKNELFELLPLLEENRKLYVDAEIDLVFNLLKNHPILLTKKTSDKELLFSAHLLVKTLKGMEIQMYVTNELPVESENIDAFRSFLLHGVLNK
jgi:AcrR family transcriptional regulator